ncbi:MAG: glutamyl-tRNA reductase [Gammaproteobacteria bacterium]
MTLALVGLNHHNAPLSLREPLAVPPADWLRELRRMQDSTGVDEAVLLSTCNRTEIYYRISGNTDRPLEAGRNWLMDLASQSRQKIEPLLYGYADLAVARHLLRVAAGLDSQIIGEPQILGQIKQAYELAHQNGFVGRDLHGLFQFVFLAAKQIRHDSGIGLHPVSIASLSVRLVEEIFDNFPARTALLIGAGETMQLVSQHLSRLHLSRLIVANRSLERARQLAQPQGGYAITLDEVPAHLAEADLIFSAAQVSEPVLSSEQVRAALERRRHSPVFIMDLGLPRNVDPGVATLPEVFLYTLDHLESLACENRRERHRAAETAEEAIDRAVEEHAMDLKGRMATPTICALRERAQKTRRATLEQALQMLHHGESPESALDFLAHTLTNRLIHLPTVQLREAAQEGRENLILAARDLFGLEDDGRDGNPIERP